MAKAEKPFVPKSPSTGTEIGIFFPDKVVRHGKVESGSDTTFVVDLVDGSLYQGQEKITLEVAKGLSASPNEDVVAYSWWVYPG